MTPPRCLSSVLLWLSGLYLLGVRAQDFSIPSSWQGTSNNLSRVDRETIALSAAQTLINRINTSTGALPDVDSIAAAETVSVLALQDLFIGNTTNNQLVSNALDAYTSQTQNYSRPYGSWNTNTLYWGLAALYAHRAYANASALELATASWNLAHMDFVTPIMAQSGTLPRAPSFNSSCSSALVGGVFSQHANQSDGVLGAEATGLFMSLSAYLHNITQNATYLDAAQLSGTFIQDHLYIDGAVAGGFDATNCSSDTTPLSRPWYTGIFIEGLAALANSTANNTWYQTLENTISPAVSRNSWYRADGVLQVEPDTTDLLKSTNMQKCLLLRGLLAARMLNLGTPMATLIEAFVNVQYHAVTTLARLPDASQYSSSWIGPATTTFDALGSIAAMDVLTAGFVIATDAEQTKNSSDTTSTRHVNIAAIVGSGVGGVVGLLGLGAILFSVCRRRRRRAHRKSATSSMRPPAHALVEPFIARPGLNSSEYHPNEKTYVGDSSTSLAVLPAPARGNVTRMHFRTESATSPDLATVARQVERIAHFLDTWSPSNRAPQTEYLVPPRTAPPQYSRTSTSRS